MTKERYRELLSALPQATLNEILEQSGQPLVQPKLSKPWLAVKFALHQRFGH